MMPEGVLPSTHLGSALYEEHDDRWTAVDNYASLHLLPGKDTPLQKSLANCLKISDAAGLDTPIAVSAPQGSFLALQCQLLGVKNVLEVGTLGGYSALWMTSASAETKVTTVDVDANATEAATRAADEAVKKYGYSGGERVEAIHGAGLDVLPRLVEEVKAGKRERFGFVFIDADKRNNLAYLEMAMELSTPGACIVVDNVVRRGMLAMTEQQLKEIGADVWSMASVDGARKVIEAVGKHERVVGSTLLQLVGEKNYDGLLMCMVK